MSSCVSPPGATSPQNPPHRAQSPPCPPSRAPGQGSPVGEQLDIRPERNATIRIGLGKVQQRFIQAVALLSILTIDLTDAPPRLSISQHVKLGIPTSDVVHGAQPVLGIGFSAGGGTPSI